MGQRYFLCPECTGLAAETNHEYFRGYVQPHPCPRCGRRGTLTEAEMTPAEIEADERFWREDAEARNRVDFGP